MREIKLKWKKVTFRKEYIQERNIYNMSCDVTTTWNGDRLIIQLELDGEIFDEFEPIGNEILENLFKREIQEFKRDQKINQITDDNKHSIGPGDKTE